MAKQSLIGLFEKPDSAADAMDGFNNGGYELGSFDVLTGTPYP